MADAPRGVHHRALPFAIGGAAALGSAAATLAVGLPALAVAGIAVPAYALGHGVARLIASRRKPTSPPKDDDAEILAGLATFRAQIRGKVPASVEARVSRVADIVVSCIPRLDQLGPASVQGHTVLRTASSYLPEAVAAYLRLPRAFADNRPVAGGKTSLVVLCDQLDLLGAKMDEVFDAVCRADADALIAHGRFLAEKFGAGSALTLPDLTPAPAPPTSSTTAQPGATTTPFVGPTQ